MRWATRQSIHIDRASSAWLIRRFIDPSAQFVFVADPAEVPTDATPFDMTGVDLSHHGSDCTFDTTGDDMNSGPVISSSVGRLIACTSPQKWPLF